MSGTFKMTKLDYYTAKSLIIENIVAIFIINGCFSYMQSSINTFCFTAAWYAALSSINIFMIQEKNRLERLYSSLSLDCGNIVRGRYIFCYIQYLIILSITIMMGSGARTLFGEGLRIQEILTAVCESFLIFTAATCIQIPVCMRLPYSKARFWCALVLMALVGIVTYAALNTSQESGIRIITSSFLSLIYVAVSIVLLLASYTIAIYCYKMRMRRN